MTASEPGPSAERISADWLTLREAADAAARRPTRHAVAEMLTARRPRRIIDVGCGTGSGGRWLQRQLAGDEEWVLLDHDPDLLTATAERLRERGARGPVHRRCGDVGMLDEILGAEQCSTLVIASALLDLLTRAQLEELVAAAARHRAPMLLALTVTGGMTAEPSHPADELVAAAFDRHQQREGRCGPQAVGVLEQAAAARRLSVERRETPWVLDAAAGPDAELLEQLIPDRAGAAVEQLADEQHCPDAENAPGSSPGRAQAWRDERLGQLRAGRLRLRIDHCDLLVAGADEP